MFELLTGFSRALHASEIASRLGVSEAGQDALSRILSDLVFDGSIVPLAGNRFRAAHMAKAESRGAMKEGFLSAHPRGFGFVATEGDADDIFIPEESMRGAMHGDRVRVRVVATGVRGTEGAIDEILERRTKRVAGAIQKRGKSAWLTPDDARLKGPIVLQPNELNAAASHGDIVIIELTRFPESRDENPEGKVIEVLGAPGTPDVEVRKILALANVNEAHPERAVNEAKAFSRDVDPKMLEGRVDLTEFPLPTIDPEDARDHDDAIWAMRLPEGGYRVIVAIADVSAYVTEGSALDESARERGCSIYLPDRAIPMLPRELSSHLCSLLPNVVRLCLAADLTLDAAGETTSVQLVEGFMNSRAKLTYPDVALTLGLTNEGVRNPAAEAMRADLEVLREISSMLRARRMQRGALDFDLPETKILVDPETKLPISASKRGKDPGVAKAYQIVEELMLLANETVATFLTNKKAPAIFRNHGVPDPAKVQRFVSLCAKFGVTLDPEDAIDSKKLSNFVKKLRETEGHSILDTLLVRTLKQAVYDVTNIGHFGLASTAYLHFTSPIRRYPDLVVHRVVRQVLRGKKNLVSEEGVEQMRAAAVLASERERRAMQVERDVVDLYGALLMRDSVGDRFTGTVTGIVGSGVFVTLEEPFVSVLVKMDALGQEEYEADEDGFAVSGKRSGDRVSLGDVVQVEVIEVSLERRMTYARRIATTSERSEVKPLGFRAKKAAEKSRREAKSAREEKPTRGKKTGRSKSTRKVLPKNAKAKLKGGKKKKKR